MRVLYVAIALFLLAPRLIQFAFKRLNIEHDVSQSHVFPDERINVSIRIRNDGWIPLPWLLVGEPASYPLTASEATTWVCSLGPKGQQQFTYTLAARRRGIYRLGHVRGQAGDWFGHAVLQKTWNDEKRFVCFPTVFSVSSGGLEGLLPMGPRIDRRSPFRDHEQLVGLRPYEQGDPWRVIAWKASAHAGEWLVKEQPPVRERELALFINLNRDDFVSLPLAAGVEKAISTAASLVWHLRHEHNNLGLWACASLQTGDDHERSIEGIIRHPARPGRGASLRILESLAAMEPVANMNFASVLKGEGRTLPPGTTIVVITPRATSEIVRASIGLCRSGHRLYLLILEDDHHMRQHAAAASETEPTRNDDTSAPPVTNEKISIKRPLSGGRILCKRVIIERQNIQFVDHLAMGDL